jgi:hypothetical protein
MRPIAVKRCRATLSEIEAEVYVVPSNLDLGCTNNLNLREATEKIQKKLVIKMKKEQTFSIHSGRVERQLSDSSLKFERIKLSLKDDSKASQVFCL